MKKKIRVLSLFDGIAGARQALKNLNIDCQYFASEIDKYAIQVAKNNHPDIIHIGGVAGIEAGMSDFEKGWFFFNQDNDPMKNGGSFEGDIDLMVSGFPCQSFSAAGNMKGLDDPRGQLFFELMRIFKEVKPKYFLFENVASMTKENKRILSEYIGIDFVEINSALLTAQQRKRIYFVGKRNEDGTYSKVEIKQPEDKKIFLKDILESGEPYQDKSHALTATYDKAVFWNSLEKKQRTMIAEPICVASRGRNIVDGKRIDKKGSKTEQRLEPNLSGKTNTLTTVAKDNLIMQPIRLGHFNKGGQGDRIYSVKGKSVCLGANGGGRGAKTGLYKIDLPDGDYLVRKLTLVECARLQGFPDSYHEGISNSQAYKCYGNSFTVPVIEHILKQLLEL
jgi:DNA (cytosine-5)-methyltransferase 3A